MSPHPIPHTVQPYVDAIGADAALQFLLTFGGCDIYLARRPRRDSDVATAIGVGPAAALGRALGQGHIRVPLANVWVTRELYARGWRRSAIARRLRTSREVVRRYLLGIEPGAGGAPDGPQSAQLDLFRDRGL